MIACPGLSIHAKLEGFRQERKYSDVSICVAGRTFECHRIILAAASSYFDSMFCGNFKESYAQEVELHDIPDPELFEKILYFIYCGELSISEDNVFNLLCMSELLSVQTSRDLCIEFILKNMYSMENVIEIFLWALNWNILQLVDPLFKCISHDFIRLSKSTAFLKMPSENLYAILKFNRFKKPSLFKVDDPLVDALVRWLHFSYAHRKDNFEILGALISPAKISPEYLKFLSEEYKIDLPNPSKKESFFKMYTRNTCSEGCSSNLSSFFSSFADQQFLKNRSSIHMYFGEKIFSINTYKPDGFISHVKERQIKSDSMKQLFTSSESDYLYCMSDDKFFSQSFCVYLSIDLSNVQHLCPPPIYLSTKGAIDGNNKNIYFGWTDGIFNERNEKYSASYKAFTNEEFATGVFHYNMEMDAWFTVPQMRMKTRITARPVIVDDVGVVYFVPADGNDMQALDIRCSQRLKLPGTYFSYGYNFCCCALDGKIYVSDGKNVEMFDSTANKWEILQSAFFVRKQLCGATYMMPYESKIWLFDQKKTLPNFEDGGLTLQVFDPNSRNWFTPPEALSSEVILAKCGIKKYDYNLDDVIVFT